MEKIKVLLDTDIGSDIDDALALSYLLSEPRCELMGITTVTGEPQKRAMIAHLLCSIADKNIPIFPGAAFPMYGKQHQDIAPQAAALKNWNLTKDFPEEKAIHFLRKTIYENPGEIILLCIGPLTNIGLLFSIDPQIPSLLKGLVMMCGIFHYQLPELKNYKYEWNATGDPFATSIVYNTALASHRSIGLDVTFKVTLERSEVQNRLNSRFLKPVLAFSQQHTCPYITFHDPLAAMSIFHNDILRYEKGRVYLEHEEDGFAVKTGWRKDSNTNHFHEVASEVNENVFFERYFSALSS